MTWKSVLYPVRDRIGKRRLLRRGAPGVSRQELAYLVKCLPYAQARRFVRNTQTVLSIVDRESFYPNLPRKPREERLLDQMIWREKHGHYNNAYNEYGLDVVGLRNADDYFDRYEMRERKDDLHHAGIDPRRYEMMSINKLWFYSYMEKVAPGTTPLVRLAFRFGKVVTPYNHFASIQKALDSLPAGVFACKRLVGEKGKGFFKVEKLEDGSFVFNAGDDTLEGFKNSLRHGSYILQDYVVQHPAVSALSAGSVNTIRIATMRYHKKAHVFYALIRMSAVKEAQVDNASQGGTFVGIDEETGRLRKYGMYDDDIHYRPVMETRHPVTGVTYEGYQIPYWKEIVQLVTTLHRQYFGGLILIGWDIAVTEQGPMVLEINSNPCSKMAQMANGGLQKKWDELKEAE